MISNKLCLIILIGFLITACSRESGQKTPTLFTKIDSKESGLNFTNTITDIAKFNVLEYPLLYNGGGVAIGDINNDGLSDIFLTGNLVSSRLYLNKGNMKFSDITESAGVTTNRWVTGVSMVDINNDGFIDIYLSVAGTEETQPGDRSNLLFVNNRDSTFTESANMYKIADSSYTTHAAFLDYNKDGFLDLFLLNHSPGSFSRTMGQKTGKLQNTSKSYDKLYKNNGNGSFTDVSVEAGILQKTGYGLGVTVNDLNRDGWPDIYVSNDLTPDDVLYINNRDGTFMDKAKTYLKHTSYAGMGVDISDFNNDGWADILQADMMPPDYNNRKLMSYGVNYDHFSAKIEQGYHYSYTKNTLQLGNGVDSLGNVLFSEIGRIAGIAYTGWSWSALFGDYNNSGHKDIMITNGYPKAVNDFDFVVNMATTSSQEQKLKLLQNLKKLKLRNYFFKNEGDLTFTDVSEKWGFKQPTYSYGAAHSDLDNDGDLDIVINNLNAHSTIYQNNSDQLQDNHYLTIKLRRPETNKQGIGAKVVLTAGGVKQNIYQSPYRGYQSSVDPNLHFGLGATSHIDSLEVFWPDGKYQLQTNLNADQQVIVDYNNSTGPINYSFDSSYEGLQFVNVTKDAGFDYEHVDNKFNDYQIQPLLDHKLSRMGPRIAVADINDDGLDDFFIGGATNQAGILYLQKADGKFKTYNTNQPWLADKSSEDMGSLFFYANGDSLLDLYVTSGGYESSPSAESLSDRLYINSGNGQFYKDKSAIPKINTSNSVVTPGDIDQDGDQDLFVGGRLVPLKYPYGTRSYILRNENGKFKDVTEEVAPDLFDNLHLITDAVWLDFDGDNQVDLVTSGEWEAIQFYKNNNGRLTNVTESVAGKQNKGRWLSLEKGDFNEDGMLDIIAGNLGLNHTFTTSENKKFEVFANDFNNDLTVDIIYTINEDGKLYPFFGRARLGQAFGFVREQFKTYLSFSKQTLENIFQSEYIRQSLHYQVDTFASMYFQNNGNGTFSTHKLPNTAQISPITGMISHDVDQDGHLDIIIAGNLFSTHPDISRADAGNGLWMKGDGKGTFKPISPFDSGFLTPHDVKDLALIQTTAGKAVLVTNNSGELQLFRIK